MSKTIVITGTSSGFGKLLAVTLAGEGHSVIAGMRNLTTKNAAVAAELGAIPNIEVVELDVTKDDSFDNTVKRALKKYGHIDVLVNNAGVTGFGVFEAVSIDTQKKIFETNLWGMVRGYQAVLPSMRAQRSGLIINVSSVLGIFSGPYLVPYNMSKFAIQGMTEGVRQEVRRFGIDTVTVLPGAFDTGVATRGGHDADRQDIVDSYGSEEQEKIQKFGGNMFAKMAEFKMDPQEVADAIKHLIDLKPGTRPNETVVNRISESYDQQFADSKLASYKETFNRYGWGEFIN